MARFAAWARKLDQNEATPSVVIGASQTEPGRLVLCLHPQMSVAELRRLLTFCLSELDAVCPADREPSAPDPDPANLP